MILMEDDPERLLRKIPRHTAAADGQGAMVFCGFSQAET